MTTIGQVFKGMYSDTNTRYNLSEIPSELEESARIKLQQQACSVACLVEKAWLVEVPQSGSTHYQVNSRVPTLARKLENAYAEEARARQAEQKRPPQEEETVFSYRGPFGDEPSLGYGTAFLVGKQLILTPAHCICDSFSGVVSRVKLAGFRVIFGFQMQPSGDIRTKFDSRDVYRIDAVWQYRYTRNADWAVLKLDREVEGRDPLSLATSQMVSLNTPLYMLGHPSGLPLKLTMSGHVQNTSSPHFFEADLDAFAGNSGSPVFASNTGNMIGMLVRGNRDYTDPTSSENKHEIEVSKISKEEIEKYGYEKCHKIASIGFVKTVLTSSFKMAYAHFSGRIKYLESLKPHLAALFPSTRVYILYGPGGVGKSELAIAFANQNIEDFSFIWSISCGTEEEQRVGYQGLAKRLEVPLDEKDTLASLINKVNRRLEQNSSKPWLLLLDNLQTSPELPGRGGSALITSYRSLNIQPLPEGAVVATEVLPLEPEEALKFLEGVTEKPLGDCQRLLDCVGCYPLLLGQVASYIRHTGIEVEEYLASLDLRGSVSGTQEGLAKTPKMALEAAFSMTLQQLFPAAKKWLFICSQLNAALIPVSYLKTWLDAEGLSEEQAAIIAVLEQYALLRYNAQEEVFSLHLEFQRILKSIAPADIGPQVVQLLVKTGNSWDFDNASNWGETMKKATIWASHAEPIVEALGGMQLDGLGRASLLDGLGRWEEANARYGKALAYHSEALKIRRATLGEAHPDVARSLRYVGICQYSQGNYNEALKTHAQALKIRRAAFGENHPDIATSLNGIGSCYYSLGNYTEALKLYGEALKIRRAAFGENHPDVASSLNNIGSCYDSLGNYNEALKLYEEALKIYRAAFGENHPDVATSLNNIATCYYSLGNYTEALKLYEKALKIYRAAFGENHPDVAMSLNNIGNCYYSLGNYTEALKLYGEALKIRRAAFGENHPDVAASLTGIGICYKVQGNYTEALKLYGEALKIYRAAFGENHPDVAMSLNNIGSCYDEQGNYTEALNLYGEALKIRRAAFGENHPDVAMSLNSIGACYYNQGNYTEALKLYEEALKIKRAAFGENHPDVAMSLNNIATCYYSLGNYTETLKLYEEALKIRRAAFGENHPDVATSLNNIGACYSSQRNYTEALKMHAQALKIRRAALGENHPDVAVSLSNIGNCYYNQGNYTEALKMYDEALKIYRAAFGENHPDVAKTLRDVKDCLERLGLIPAAPAGSSGTLGRELEIKQPTPSRGVGADKSQQGSKDGKCVVS